MKVGDRVVVPSTIACGYCSYCRTGYHAHFFGSFTARCDFPRSLASNCCSWW
ncbi:alcohol dehydrogenase catalytic domain-containing protein [Nostoc sp. MG11]|uniref:alcohol dehydrogenase catalytic domain-containing protein n=1 Tax=Nostoc sp. MG11 TaxID=2721166 RepID=UPI001D01AFD9|nr:alcohol dehydrogenase catalytic domain-containing protein [Nostoc sp. MG11]